MDPGIIAAISMYSLIAGGGLTTATRAGLYRGRLFKHLQSLATELGWSDVRRRLFSGKIRGNWNGLPVFFQIDGVQKGALKVVMIKLAIGKEHQRFYLQNATLPMIYNFPFRSMRNARNPARLKLNPADDAMFAAFSEDSTDVEKLLATPSSRRLLVRNLIEEDGEFHLEDGNLIALRTTRMRIRIGDSKNVEALDQILRDQWDLLRTAVAVLVPSKMKVADREALKLFCPYCKEELTESTDLVKCSECKTLHHRDCWKEADKCSVYGCTGVPLPFVKS